MLLVGKIKLRVDMNKSHVIIIKLHIDTIYLACINRSMPSYKIDSNTKIAYKHYSCLYHLSFNHIINLPDIIIPLNVLFIFSSFIEKSLSMVVIK